MSNTFSFVCATTKSNNFIPLWKKSLDSIKHDNICDFNIEYNNTNGLCTVYNKYFDKLDSDYVICIHDDVRIDDINFFDKIIHYCKFYDILGVAGGKTFSFLKYDKLSWMSVLNVHTDLAGAVQHNINTINNKIEEFSTIGYGTSPAKVLSIDGLIMIFSKKAYKTLRFDEQFYFDFYDLDLCFSAYKNNISIGVVPISTTHYSCGLGILEDKYLNSQQKFIKKWNR